MKLFPDGPPPECGENCRCIYQGDSDKFTLAIYAPNRILERDRSHMFCAYLASCGMIVKDGILVEPTDRMSQTLEKAVQKLLPQMISMTYVQSQTSGTVWH